MRCVICEKEAQAICRFCGRAVCAEHVREQRYSSGFTKWSGVWSRKPHGVEVPDAVWCGVCHPEFVKTA